MHSKAAVDLGELWRALMAISLIYLVAAQSAHAAVLYDQTEAASHASVPSQESPDEPASTTQAADDIVVPAGEHWEVTEVEVLEARLYKCALLQCLPLRRK